MKKFMLRIMPVVLVALVVLASPSFAAVDLSGIANPGAGIGTVNNVAKRIWSTVLTILQICAVAAVVFAGVKYMFASADAKAEIKNSMIGLVVGAILVFGASTFINIILNISEEAGVK